MHVLCRLHICPKLTRYMNVMHRPIWTSIDLQIAYILNYFWPDDVIPQLIETCVTDDLYRMLNGAPLKRKGTRVASPQLFSMMHAEKREESVKPCTVCLYRVRKTMFLLYHWKVGKVLGTRLDKGTLLITFYKYMTLYIVYSWSYAPSILVGCCLAWVATKVYIDKLHSKWGVQHNKSPYISGDRSHHW